jgi:ribulose 1,5-bisphosphate synthetase/thiazole synthase
MYCYYLVEENSLVGGGGWEGKYGFQAKLQYKAYLLLADIG